MATFVALIHDTCMSTRTIRETVNHLTAFEYLAKRMQITLKEIYWTYGQYDGIVILEAPDYEKVSALMTLLSSTNSVQTEVLRAYSRNEMNQILTRFERLSSNN